MTKSPRVTLSPHEEITLRRVAHGANPDHLSAQVIRRLQRLMLVLVVSGTPELTAFGWKRYDALPGIVKIDDAARHSASDSLQNNILHFRRRT